MKKTKVCKGQCERTLPLNSFDRVRNGSGKGYSFRGTCRRCRKGLPPPEPEAKRFFRPLNATRYIITAAQNNTPVHGPFFETLKVAAKELGAELVVVPVRYKNPTDLREGNRDRYEYWWDASTKPYLHNVKKKLNDNLILEASVKIQATGMSPLSSFESVTGAESCIIAHAKMQLKTVAVPTGRYPKILTTTGACTQRNYSSTKAGKLGEFHHFLGAVVVEIRGKGFRLWQINADRFDGSFTHLNQHFTERGVFPAAPALALVLGDYHIRVRDPGTDSATFGPGGIVETLNPEVLVWHDVADGETVNPHDMGNAFIAEAKRKAQRQDVKAEVQETVDLVNERSKGRKSVIVESNHHDFFARWAIKTDFRSDLKNAEFLLETQLMMLRSSKMGPGGAEYEDPFQYWMRKLGAGPNIKILKANESFKVEGIECGLHGNNGPNGARGNLKNLSRLGCKVISGHTHTPGIEEGHYQVGTSSHLRLSYMKGPSSHLNAHCVIYATGKRSLVFIVDGAWRAVA